MPKRDHTGKLRGAYYSEMADKAHEEAEIRQVWDEGAKREARLRKRIESGDLTAEEWQWLVQCQDRNIEFWTAEWHEKMGAIGDLCQARAARNKALKRVIGHCRRRRDSETRNGHHEAVEALSDVLIWLMELDAGHLDTEKET